MLLLHFANHPWDLYSVSRAALLVAADLVGANLPGGLQLPVGVTAGLLGGAYLLLLLNGQERKK